MNVAVLVPRRADGGHRDRIWRFVKAWWTEHHPDWPIIEGESPAGPFNRAAAINDAHRKAGERDTYLVLDGDVIDEHAGEAVQWAFDTGRMTLAYTKRQPLNETMTEQVLDGYDGDWHGGIDRRDVVKSHVSSCLAVPRSLWDEVGGFDERFRGWGPEDRAFAEACRVLGGGIETVAGEVWHLWHPWSVERGRTRLFEAGRFLMNRYYAAVEPAAMRQLLAERAADGVVLAVVTNGRRDCITRAIPSIGDNVIGEFVRKVIVDDSGDLDYRAWLRLSFPDWELVATDRGHGFDVAYQHVWHVIASTGAPYAFVVEDDFTFERPVKLADLARTLDENPHLCQMALRRQAWFQCELDAGGVIEQHPDAYTDHPTHLEHRLFVTTNPALWPLHTVIEHPWPKGSGSERRFAQTVFADPDIRAGYWGSRTDDPWVIHDGERTGSRY